jgi:hypothetical protein
MNYKIKQISKEDLRKISAGARRAIDVENGIGVNRKHQVFNDKKKEIDKTKCRKKIEE